MAEIQRKDDIIDILEKLNKDLKLYDLQFALGDEDEDGEYIIVDLYQERPSLRLSSKYPAVSNTGKSRSDVCSRCNGTKQEPTQKGINDCFECCPKEKK